MQSENNRKNKRAQTRIEWSVFAQKLRGASEVWRTLYACSNEHGFTHVTREGIARRTGLTVASIAKHLAKLRTVALVEDVGKTYKTIPVAGGFTQGWVYTRRVLGQPVYVDGCIVDVLVTTKQERLIMSRGSGGKRKGAGNPGWLAIAKEVDTPLSNRTTALSNRTEAPYQTGSPILPIRVEGNGVPSNEGSAPTCGVRITPEERGAQRPGSPQHPDPEGPDEFTRPRFQLPKAPPPLAWEHMPRDPVRVTQHFVRLYSEFREHRYGSRLWFRGRMETQKFWPAAQKAVAKMRELDIIPARWIAWVDGAVWAERSGAPPLAQMCSTKLMEEHLRWHEGTWENYFYSVTHYPPSALAAHRLWKQTQVMSFRCTHARGDAVRLEIARLVEAGEREGAAIRERLMADMRGGKWVWR